MRTYNNVLNEIDAAYWKVQNKNSRKPVAISLTEADMALLDVKLKEDSDERKSLGINWGLDDYPNKVKFYRGIPVTQGQFSGLVIPLVEP